MTEEPKQDKAYSIAQRIAQGETGKYYVHCIEDDHFYIYENNYWKILFNVEVLGNICEDMPAVNKFTFAFKNNILGHLKLLVRRRLDGFNITNHLNFADGEFNPITQDLLEHSKYSYSTMRIPYPYHHSAKCPLWERSLNEIFEGNEGKIKLLQEFFGYCLVPDTKQKKALLLLGESNTGKSVILVMLRATVGAFNCSSVPLKYLGHPQYTPMMINKLINIDADVGKDAKDYEEQFKKVTSGEEISCNQKFVETFEFIPKCRIVLAANKFPYITDQSSAFYNRLVLIPFERVFLENEQDKNLADKLRSELPGIFNWACRGLKRLNERGVFEQYDFMNDAVQDLRDESNPVDVFFREHIEAELNANLQVEKSEVYIKYFEWCKTNGNSPMSAMRFAQAIYQKYSRFTPKKAQCYLTGKRVWRNLAYVHFKTEIPKAEEITWE